MNIDIRDSAGPSRRKPTVLVIDDDPADLAMMTDNLEDRNYRILVAEDGESGIERAQYALPDLILLDVVMPAMDGYETCRRLKAVEETRDIPVIFMTALADTEHKVKGFEAGAVDYITKPFQRDEVLARVDVHLRIRELTTRLQEANESLEKRVEERTLELARTNRDLQSEVAERKRVEEALRQAHHRLEQRVKERTAELARSNEQLSCQIEERIQAEKTLEEQKILFETILKQAADGIVVTDAQGKPLFVNPAARRMALLDPEDTALDMPLTAWGESYDSRGHLIPFEKWSIPRALQGKMTISTESRMVRPDGSYYDVLMSAAPLRKSDGTIFGAVSILSDITERKRAEEAIRSLPSRLLAAQEEERKRISRDLHDSIGSSLSAIKYSLENAANQLEQRKPTLELIRYSVRIIQHAIGEVRRIYTDLRPSTLDDLGIIATIGWFCRQFQTVYPNIRIEKEIAVEEGDIQGTLKVVIFRVIQEALNNVAKYSKADLVNLSLVQREGRLRLAIVDNGVGFDLKSVCSVKDPERGLGLTSMRERVEITKGCFSIDSHPGRGTTVQASWPMSSFSKGSHGGEKRNPPLSASAESA